MKKKNTMKKKFLVLCLVTLLCSSSLICNAANTTWETNEQEAFPIMPYYVSITTAQSTISQSGDTVTGKAIITSRENGNISITMQLQKKVSGKWKKIKSWSTTAENAKTASIKKEYTISSKGTYRISATFTTNGESTIKNSSRITK